MMTLKEFDDAFAFVCIDAGAVVEIAATRSRDELHDAIAPWLDGDMEAARRVGAFLQRQSLRPLLTPRVVDDLAVDVAAPGSELGPPGVQAAGFMIEAHGSAAGLPIEMHGWHLGVGRATSGDRATTADLWVSDRGVWVAQITAWRSGARQRSSRIVQRSAERMFHALGGWSMKPAAREAWLMACERWPEKLGEYAFRRL